MINYTTGIFLNVGEDVREAVEVLINAGFNVSSENVYCAAIKQEVECQLEQAVENGVCSMEPNTDEYNEKVEQLQEDVTDREGLFSEFEENIQNLVEELL